MADKAHITRRAFVQSAVAFAGASPFAATACLAELQKEQDIAEIMRLRAQMSCAQRTFFDHQLYAMFNGEPNVIEGTASYDFEDWKSGFDEKTLTLLDRP